MLFGSTSRPTADLQHHFEGSASYKGTPPRGFSGGSYDLAMLDGPRGDAHAAVLMPNGSVYVVSAESGLEAILTSPLGGGQLLWEPSTRTLWVESGDAWSSFPLAATIRESKEKSGKPALKRASLTTKFDRKSGRAVTAFPLSDGRFALRTNTNGRSALEIFTAAGAVPQVIRSLRRPAHRRRQAEPQRAVPARLSRGAEKQRSPDQDAITDSRHTPHGTLCCEGCPEHGPLHLERVTPVDRHFVSPVSLQLPRKGPTGNGSERRSVAAHGSWAGEAHFLNGMVSVWY